MIAGAILLTGISAASASLLPVCGNKQVANMVVDEMNRKIRMSPLTRTIAGSVRIVSLEAARELHSDEAMRACDGDVKRNDGQVVAIGYTVEWYSKSNGQVVVQTMAINQLRAQYEKPATTPAPTPAAASAPAPAQAASKTPAPTPKKDSLLSDAFSKCMDDAVSMPDMTECADVEATAQDKRLNAAYKVAMAGTADKDALKTAQRQWIKSRDKQCASKGTGGQNDALESSDCVAQVTARRANELETMK